MELTGLTQAATALRGGAAAGVAGAADAGAASRVGAAGASSASFKTALADALKSVSQTQDDAAALQRAYIAGNAEVSLEQTMMALQKSQVAFQAATTVRNRLVSAYSDIMNMNV